MHADVAPLCDEADSQTATALETANLGQIQCLLLHVALVCHFANDSTKRVDLVHQLALCWTTDRRIAGLPCNTVQVECHQHGLCSHCRRCNRSLAASVSCSDHDNIVLLFIGIVMDASRLQV
jgi:hypothetical protein